MGRLVYSMITSLDGYVADEQGDFSWAMPDEVVLGAINADMEAYGIYLYGRRMYEMMAVWETDPAIAADSPGSADFARWWQAADKIVYSTSLPGVATRRTRLERSFDPEAIRLLKESTDADLTVDGPTLAAHALRAGVVDRLRMFVCPAVVGGGLAFLPDGLRLDLRLVAEQRFGNGMVGLTYDVVGAR